MIIIESIQGQKTIKDRRVQKTVFGCLRFWFLWTALICRDSLYKSVNVLCKSVCLLNAWTCSTMVLLCSGLLLSPYKTIGNVGVVIVLILPLDWLESSACEKEIVCCFHKCNAGCQWSLRISAHFVTCSECWDVYNVLVFFCHRRRIEWEHFAHHCLDCIWIFQVSERVLLRLSRFQSDTVCGRKVEKTFVILKDSDVVCIS